jgi:dipeptidyl aminopeptidase/acylaminoacyl peptidase
LGDLDPDATIRPWDPVADAGYEQNPPISPDGRRIAYVGQGIRGTNPPELHVQAIGSIDPVRLRHNNPGEDNGSPAWDPTSRTVAALRTTAGKRFARILLTPAQRGASSDLGVDGVVATGRLAWSPDGRNLAFTRLRGPEQGVIYEFSIKDRTLREVHSGVAARLIAARNSTPIVVNWHSNETR